MRRCPEALHEAVVRRYAGCGRYVRRFVHHKLRLDPVFPALLRGGWLPAHGRLYDVGCGYGILPALIAAACDVHARGQWPPDWPAPPQDLEIRGVDADAGRVRAAAEALCGVANIEQGDARSVAFEPCSAIVILDVMLYMEAHEQERLLAAVAAALEPGGLLLMREADAAAGLPFHLTWWAERLAALGHGRPRWQLHYRSAAEWRGLLESHGFAVESEPMSRGTPFANVLHAARRTGARPMG